MNQGFLAPYQEIQFSTQDMMRLYNQNNSFTEELKLLFDQILVFDQSNNMDQVIHLVHELNEKIIFHKNDFMDIKYVSVEPLLHIFMDFIQNSTDYQIIYCCCNISTTIFMNHEPFHPKYIENLFSFQIFEKFKQLLIYADEPIFISIFRLLSSLSRHFNNSLLNQQCFQYYHLFCSNQLFSQLVERQLTSSMIDSIGHFLCFFIYFNSFPKPDYSLDMLEFLISTFNDQCCQFSLKAISFILSLKPNLVPNFLNSDILTHFLQFFYDPRLISNQEEDIAFKNSILESIITIISKCFNTVKNYDILLSLTSCSNFLKIFMESTTPRIKASFFDLLNEAFGMSVLDKQKEQFLNIMIESNFIGYIKSVFSCCSFEEKSSATFALYSFLQNPIAMNASLQSFIHLNLLEYLLNFLDNGDDLFVIKILLLLFNVLDSPLLIHNKEIVKNHLNNTDFENILDDLEENENTDIASAAINLHFLIDSFFFNNKEEEF